MTSHDISRRVAAGAGAANRGATARHPGHTGFAHLFPVASLRMPPNCRPGLRAYRIHTSRLPCIRCACWPVPHFVTPASEPGSNHGSRCRRNRRRTRSTAEAAARIGAGPRLGGPGRRLETCVAKPPKTDLRVRQGSEAGVTKGRSRAARRDAGRCGPDRRMTKHDSPLPEHDKT